MTSLLRLLVFVCSLEILLSLLNSFYGWNGGANARLANSMREHSQDITRITRLNGVGFAADFKYMAAEDPWYALKRLLAYSAGTFPAYNIREGTVLVINVTDVTVAPVPDTVEVTLSRTPSMPTGVWKEYHDTTTDRNISIVQESIRELTEETELDSLPLNYLINVLVHDALQIARVVITLACLIQQTYYWLGPRSVLFIPCLPSSSTINVPSPLVPQKLPPTLSSSIPPAVSSVHPSVVVHREPAWARFLEHTISQMVIAGFLMELVYLTVKFDRADLNFSITLACVYSVFTYALDHFILRRFVGFPLIHTPGGRRDFEHGPASLPDQDLIDTLCDAYVDDGRVFERVCAPAVDVPQIQQQGFVRAISQRMQHGLIDYRRFVKNAVLSVATSLLQFNRVAPAHLPVLLRSLAEKLAIFATPASLVSILFAIFKAVDHVPWPSAEGYLGYVWLLSTEVVGDIAEIAEAVSRHIWSGSIGAMVYTVAPWKIYWAGVAVVGTSAVLLILGSSGFRRVNPLYPLFVVAVVTYAISRIPKEGLSFTESLRPAPATVGLPPMSRSQMTTLITTIASSTTSTSTVTTSVPSTTKVSRSSEVSTTSRTTIKPESSPGFELWRLTERILDTTATLSQYGSSRMPFLLMQFDKQVDRILSYMQTTVQCLSHGEWWQSFLADNLIALVVLGLSIPTAGTVYTCCVIGRGLQNLEDAPEGDTDGPVAMQEFWTSVKAYSRNGVLVIEQWILQKGAAIWNIFLRWAMWVASFIQWVVSLLWNFKYGEALGRLWQAVQNRLWAVISDPLNAARQFVRNLHTLTSQVRSWLVALIELLFTLTIGFALLLFAILVHAIIEGVKSIFSVWDAFVAGYHSFVGVWADAWQQFRNAPLTQPDDLNKRFIGIWKDLVRHELIGLGLAGSWAGYPRGRQSSADEDAASTADEREPATLTDEADAVPGDNEPEAAVDAAVDTAETPNPTFEDTPPHPAVSTRPVTEVANTADDTMVLAGAAESAGSAALTEDTDPGAFVQTRFKDSIFDASRAAGPGLLTPDVTPLPQCHNELAPATPVSPTTRVPRSQDDENEDRTF